MATKLLGAWCVVLAITIILITAYRSDYDNRTEPPLEQEIEDVDAVRLHNLLDTAYPPIANSFSREGVIESVDCCTIHLTDGTSLSIAEDAEVWNQGERLHVPDLNCGDRVVMDLQQVGSAAAGWQEQIVRVNLKGHYFSENTVERVGMSGAAQTYRGRLNKIDNRTVSIVDEFGDERQFAFHPAFETTIEEQNFPKGTPVRLVGVRVGNRQSGITFSIKSIERLDSETFE